MHSLPELIRLKPQFKNAHDIYEHYLIDPIVAPCMKTTLVLEAVTATQLFAQRVLFGVEKYRDNSNIEHTLIASEALKDQWTWIRNYRVWEANRKVFFVPAELVISGIARRQIIQLSFTSKPTGKGELDAELANGAFGKFLDDVVWQLARIKCWECAWIAREKHPFSTSLVERLILLTLSIGESAWATAQRSPSGARGIELSWTFKVNTYLFMFSIEHCT